MCQSANLQPLENWCAHKCETRKEADKKINKLYQKHVLTFLDGASGLVAEREATEVCSPPLVKPVPTGRSPKEPLPSVATKSPATCWKKFLSKCSHQEKIYYQTRRQLQMGLYYLRWSRSHILMQRLGWEQRKFAYKICKAIAGALEDEIRTQSCLDKLKSRSKSKAREP